MRDCISRGIFIECWLWDRSRDSSSNNIFSKIFEISLVIYFHEMDPPIYIRMNLIS